MARGDHALTQLLHLWLAHQRADLRLAEQEDLDQRLARFLEIRQHAQFFQRGQRQVLRLVDHQQADVWLHVELVDQVIAAIGRHQVARLVAAGRSAKLRFAGTEAQRGHAERATVVVQL